MNMKKWFVGAFLTLVMGGAIVTNAALFSVRSFQDNLQRMAPNTNGILDVASFREVEAAIQAAEVGVADERGRVIALEREAAAHDTLAERLRQDAWQVQGQIEAFLAQMEAQSATPAPQPAAADAAMVEVPAGAQLAARLRSLAAAAGTAEADRERFGAMIAAAEQIDALRAQADAKAKLAEARRAEAGATGQGVANADQRVMGLKAQFLAESPATYAAALDGGVDTFSVIRNEARALLRSSPAGVTAALAQVHPQMLSMCLVLLMGALGGVLYLFPAYMSRQNPVTFAEIIVRMVFGMCTALAFYIVMNAAIGGFSLSAGEPGGQNAMNPFSVSLIGILAGVLADDIARWIHQRGTELLGGRVGAPIPGDDPAAQDARAPIDQGSGARGPGASAGY